MKKSKLLEKAERFIDSEKRKRKEKRKCLKHVIVKLRKYERKLEKKIEEEEIPEEIERLKNKKKLAHAHRKKALMLMDGLMERSVNKENKS